MTDLAELLFVHQPCLNMKRKERINHQLCCWKRQGKCRLIKSPEIRWARAVGKMMILSSFLILSEVVLLLTASNPLVCVKIFRSAFSRFAELPTVCMCASYILFENSMSGKIVHETALFYAYLHNMASRELRINGFIIIAPKSLSCSHEE